MRLIVSIGIPGSGKTTYMKQFATTQKLAYVNPDGIRLELTGDETDHSKDPLVWRTVYDRLAAGLQTGGVILDSTLTTRRGRREIVRFAQKHGTQQITAYWFNVPLAVCMQRNERRDRTVPYDILQKMHERLVQHPPSTDEGFDQIITISE